ncbi:MAG: dihydroorotate dehydrogenase electron transfer subunit [Wujia sp.]
MSKIKLDANIIRQDNIATGIFSMVLEAREIAAVAKPGQFLNLYSADGSHLLPRPISICEIDRNLGTIRIVYRVAGAGTKEFSSLSAGHRITIMGPLGNGFTMEGNKAILIGGGIGIPPMLQLAKELNCEKSIVLGFRDEEFLSDEFVPYGKVYKSSDNGAIGVKGTVMDAIREYGIEGDVIFACGPTPMLKAIAAYAKEKEITAQISLEERMACGVGACLACVCQSKEIDDHSKVHNKRICKDGPVFYAEEVELS